MSRKRKPVVRVSKRKGVETKEFHTKNNRRHELIAKGRLTKKEQAEYEELEKWTCDYIFTKYPIDYTKLDHLIAEAEKLTKGKKRPK